MASTRGVLGLLLLCAGLALPLPAGATPPRGGNGGSPFNLDCGNDAVLAGASIRVGTLVDSVEAVCVKVNGDGSWSGGYFNRGKAGGGGGAPLSLYCDSGWAVMGIHGRSGTLVDRLGVRCGKLGNQGGVVKIVQGDITRGPGGGGGGNPFDDTCPGGQVGRGLKGRAGTLVDQIELPCHNPSVPAPTTTTMAPRAATGQLQGVTSQQFLALWPASVSLNPAQIGGGSSVSGVVTLTAMAPEGGAQVTLTSDKPNAATVPATVRVPAGQNSAGFTVATRTVSADTTVTLSATLGGTTKTATLTVGVPKLGRIMSSWRSHDLDLWNIYAELDGPAPAGGAVVNVSSQNTAVARVPATITISQGQTTGSAPIEFTRPTGSPVTVTLSGTYAGSTKTGTVTVRPVSPPPVVSSVTPMSARAGGFFSVCGTNLTSLKLGSRTVGADASGPCPNNESRLDMRVPNDLTPGSYTMSMSNGGGTWTGTQNFTVLDASGQAPQQSGTGLVSVSVNPTALGGGASSAGVITLGAIAGDGGTQITLSSDKPNAATVPATVRVPAGQSSVGFTVTTRAVTADTPVVVSATLGGTTKTAALTVGVPKLARIMSSWRSHDLDLWNIYADLDGPAPAGGAVVSISSQNTAVARVPATITVSQGQTTGSAPIEFTRPSGNAVTVTLSGAYAGSTKTGTVTVRPVPPPPVVSSVTPMSARAGGFFSLCGTNLTNLKLGSRTVGADASGPCPNNESRLDMRVPTDLTPGSYTMSMENAGGTWTGTQNFTVTSP